MTSANENTDATYRQPQLTHRRQAAGFVLAAFAVVFLPVVISTHRGWAQSRPAEVVAPARQAAGMTSPSHIVSMQGVPKAANASARARARVVENYGKLPLSFEANHGQTARQVKFLSRGAGYTVYLTTNEAVLALRKSVRRSRKLQTERASLPFGNRASKSMVLLPVPETLRTQAAQGRPTSDGAKAERAVVRMHLVNASAAPKITGLRELPGKSNYMIGNNPKKWHTNVPTYAEVHYHGVYRGIDLVYHGNHRQLEYDFVVAPGASPSAIKLAITSAEWTGARRTRAPLAIDLAGNLKIEASTGEISFHKPGIYQQDAKGRRHFIAGGYSLDSSRGIVSFKVANYDHTRPLVIDPELVYSTYLGGADRDLGLGIAVDSSQNVYITGQTYSTDFPTQNPLAAPYNALQAPTAAFVTKLNATGTALVYSTYLGGNVVSGTSVGTYAGHAIAVDALGDAYVAGVASGPSNFPTTNGAYQKNCRLTPAGYCLTAFLSKLGPSGSTLLYSTYIGGSGGTLGDTPYSLAVDTSGNAYVTGQTFSTDFPTTTGALQTSPPNPAMCTLPPGASTCLSSTTGCSDAFAVKINSTGSAALYSTYLGGACDYDIGQGIAVDSSGNAYIAGYTTPAGTSTSPGGKFPTTAGSYQPNPAGTGCSGGLPCGDGFVTKLTSNGSGMVYSTLLGGAAADSASGIALDSSGNAYVTGTTGSADFPIMNPIASFAGHVDAYVAKLNAAGNGLVYSTYLGGTNFDYGIAIAVDGTGSAYVTGETNSTDFPTLNATQGANSGGFDGFLTELNPPGNTLIFSTYLGGAGNDTPQGVALDSVGDAYVTGFTSSTDFPTTSGAFQTQAPTPSNCVNFPSGYIPFTQITQNAGGQVVVGLTTLAAYNALSSIPVPSSNNEPFCNNVELAPGQYFNAYVPTASERNGDFGIYPVTLLDPTNNNQPFLGNQIPPSELGGVMAWHIGAPYVPSGDAFVAKVAATPQQAAGAITNLVNALSSSGTINKGQNNSLLQQLQNSITLINSGKINGAIGNLESFIGEVNGLLNSGALTSDQASSLINAANSVISQLQ